METEGVSMSTHIVGNKQFIELPGRSDRVFELPPLIVSGHPEIELDIINHAEEIIERNGLLTTSLFKESYKQQKTDLAVTMTEEYIKAEREWRCGDNIHQWTEACKDEVRRKGLTSVASPDVLPNPWNVYFVELLVDKSFHLPTNPRRAFGLRLSFSQFPSIDCLSLEFLMYIKTRTSDLAYQTLKEAVIPLRYLPPERFHVEMNFL